jgi:predicted DNA binding protein
MLIGDRIAIEMAQSDSANGGVGGGHPIRAQLAVKPHPDSTCAVINEGRDATEVTHHLKSTPDAESHQCNECHTELSFDDGGDRTYLKSAVGANCICPVFQQHDCIPRITAVDGGAIVTTLTVPERGILQEILDSLKDVGASVTVEWLVNGTDTATTTEIDASSVTEKQQEAMALAREMGYYETPREAGLSDIADELDVSESAVSQRLNAAETKLVQAFLDDHQ